MDVRMYEVNFGEAIIYEDKGEKLLVDCGAKFYGKGIDAFNAIKFDFSSGQDDVLITHFDEDHYNGLIEMASAGMKVRRLYLPKYIYLDKNVQYTENYFIDQLRAIMYLHVLGKKHRLNSIQKLFKAIPTLTAPRYNIKTVAYKDIINIGESCFDVLWPEVSDRVSFKSLSDRLRDICVESTTSNNDNVGIRQVDDTINDYLRIFIDFYSFVNENGDRLNNIDEQDGNTFGDLEGQYTELSNRFDTAHQRLEGIEKLLELDISEDNMKTIDSKFSNLIKSQNDCSVVFACEERVLALGDASKKVVKHLCRESRLKNTYKLLKAPHHGTVAYYSSMLPDAKCVFISNSGGMKLNWMISEEYPNRYGQKVHCTNTERNRCESLKSKKGCCRYCNVPFCSRRNPVSVTI